MTNNNNPESFGEKIATKMSTAVGSWTFLIVQSIILMIWMTGNGLILVNGFDPYPFVLLNLALSTQAAFATPVIMISQNRQDRISRDRAKHIEDTVVNEMKIMKENHEDLEQLIKSIKNHEL